ncbi:MAG: UDP-2,4-diacetamido-2,4,6-trideoxy-beta-L-altropyranose hydrolase [Rhodobacteraceae bacterium]|nr:UDP-2,4-diacetamido-2,4,6-trideoxy-beta-L-altropyranose hydrolase [Paracoccaceae bacterium]
MPQTIAFRVDASLDIGSGHLMRCLTLADALLQAGHACHFLSRAGEGGLDDLILNRGHAFHGLSYATKAGYGAHLKPPVHAAWLGAAWHDDAEASAQILASINPDWLLVDHYALDKAWEAVALPAGAKLMVLDDLADRAHMCEVLLDQNLGRQGQDYDGLVPDSCTRLIGPEYALLRPEFQAFRQRSLERRQNAGLAHILITMGGVDKDDVTSRVLEVLAHSVLPAAAHITVVMGQNAPALGAVQAKALRMPCPTRVLVSIDNMAEIMASADIAIGAAGSTSWERCCLGLPTLLLTIADNQKEAAIALERSGSVVLLGDTRETGWEKKLESLLPDLNASALEALTQKALSFTKGSGCALTMAKMGLS